MTRAHFQAIFAAYKMKKISGLHAYPVETREKAYQLFAQGNTHDETSKLVDVLATTIQIWSRRYRWKARRLAERGMSEAAPAKERQRLNESRGIGEQQSTYLARMRTEAMRLPEIMSAMSDKEYIGNADKIAKLDATARKALGLESDKPTLVVNVGLLAGTEAKRPRADTLPTARILPAYEVPALVMPTGILPADTIHAPHTTPPKRLGTND